MPNIRRLEDMSLDELWMLFPIVLEPHNPQWISWADEEIALLRSILAPISATYHHIGSTAVRGIMAKPIVDIIIAVESPAELPVIKDKLIAHGYICMSESRDRISLNKGYTPQGYAERVFHIHLRLIGDIDEIYFRDYLREHDDVAQAYEALKVELADMYKHDRDAYTAAKSKFVNHYTKLAKLSH